MRTRLITLVLVTSLTSLVATGCGDEKPSAEPSTSGSAKPKPKNSGAAQASSKPSAQPATTVASTSSGAVSTAPSGAASAAPSGSASAGPPADVCDPKEKWTPTTATVKFDWTDKPKLELAPADGMFAWVGAEPFKLDSVEIWVNKKNKEWDIRMKGGPLGPSLSFKGEPKANEVVEDKMGSNRGYFQVPKKGNVAECFSQTTSDNVNNARIVKLTAYDAKAKTADGTVVTTWEETFGEKRKFWAAGTFKGAKVNISE